MSTHSRHTPAPNPLGEQTTAGRVLLALRPGPVERAGLIERLGKRVNSDIRQLTERGLIVMRDDTAHITVAGLQHCPSRRPTGKLEQKDVRKGGRQGTQSRRAAPRPSRRDKTPPAKDTQNGVTRPKTGTKTGHVWDIADILSAQEGASDQ